MIAGKFGMVRFDPDKKQLFQARIQKGFDDFDDFNNGFKADGKIYMKGQANSIVILNLTKKHILTRQIEFLNVFNI